MGVGGLGEDRVAPTKLPPIHHANTPHKLTINPMRQTCPTLFGVFVCCGCVGCVCGGRQRAAVVGLSPPSMAAPPAKHTCCFSEHNKYSRGAQPAGNFQIEGVHRELRGGGEEVRVRVCGGWVGGCRGGERWVQVQSEWWWGLID